MTTPRRMRGTSLAVRLAALITVPMLTLGYFATRYIQHEQAVADDAAALVDTIELQQAVGAVYPLAQVDRIALEGLARIDELNLSRSLVVMITRVDLEELYDGNIPVFEAALERLRDDFGETALRDGSTLGERLDEVIDDIDLIRARVDDQDATPAEVQTAVGPLASLLDEALEAVRSDRTTGTELDGARVQLDTLSHVVASAGEHARVVMRNVLYQSDELRAEATMLRSAHEAFLQAHYTTLSPDQRSGFEHLLTAEAALPTPPVSGRSEPGSALADTAMIAESAQAVLAHLDYLTAVQDYSSEFHQAQVDRAEQAAADGRAGVQRTIIALVTLALATALFTGYVLWTVLAPIRSLTRRAEAISRGELEADPLPVKGPTDVRALVSTTNDMVETLDRMRSELSRMAAGELGGALTADLPGAIGVTMRESVQRIAELTDQLQRSEQFASAVVDEAADAIWTVDELGTIRTANNAAARMCRAAPDEQIGRPIKSFLSTTNGEVTIGTGATQLQAVVVSSEVDVGGERITIVIAHDISERARFEERLAYQASHDALTGLPNRFSLFQHLEQRRGAGRPPVVLFVDLDGFKSVNDTQGHAVGDQVLTSVAERLGRCVGPDDFIGRLGGDEFVIVSGRRDEREAEAFGARVIHELERPLTVGDHVFTMSASVGISVPEPGTSAIDMIRQADNAVYQAKRRGRGRVEMYDATMEDRIAHEADLELALRNAVRNDELVLHLQPMVDLRTGDIVGAEALVRWERPGNGLVPPGDFIPIAERSSLIYEIERWVIAEVCRHLVDWSDRVAHDAFRIAVNISGRHLTDGDLIGDLRSILDETGADPRMLELELTETQLLEDVERATAILDELRSWGITIAVDDFGTGYSSLTYLRHLPLDTVKIDRSFVAHATEHGYDSTVIDALLTISRSLELSVVAEGVETGDQLAYLRDRGCDRAQGFLLARPLPVDEVEPLLLDGQAALRVAVS